jgi:hypothetical protein
MVTLGYFTDSLKLFLTKRQVLAFNKYYYLKLLSLLFSLFVTSFGF